MSALLEEIRRLKDQRESLVAEATATLEKANEITRTLQEIGVKIKEVGLRVYETTNRKTRSDKGRKHKRNGEGDTPIATTADGDASSVLGG